MIVYQYPLLRLVTILAVMVCLGIPLVFAGDIAPIQGSGNASDNNTVGNSGNNSPSYHVEQNIHSNSTVVPINRSKTITQNTQNNSTTDTTSSREKYYASISDIIKAHDWVALQNYTDKLKQDNPNAFTDPSPSTEAGWKVRFPIRTPAPIAQPCCDG